MIAKLIRWSIANRFLVLLATVMVTAWGVWSLLRMVLTTMVEMLINSDNTINDGVPGKSQRLDQRDCISV